MSQTTALADVKVLGVTACDRQDLDAQDVI